MPSDEYAYITAIIDSRIKPHVHRDFRCGICYCDANRKPHIHVPTCDTYVYGNPDAN